MATGRNYRGTKIVTVRLHDALEKRIDMEIANSKQFRNCSQVYCRSSWIMQAIVEKLQHLDRGRRKRKGKSSVPFDQVRAELLLQQYLKTRVSDTPLFIDTDVSQLQIEEVEESCPNAVIQTTSNA